MFDFFFLFSIYFFFSYNLYLLIRELIMAERKFTKSFDAALQQAYVFHAGFLTDKADFVAASPLFDDPFAANFLTDIQAADALPTLDDDNAVQFQFAYDLEGLMKLGREQYQKLLLYVKLAYPDDEAAMAAFKAEDYERDSKSTLRMINLMQNAYMIADSSAYKTDLIAVGFLQTDIDMLDSLADDIDSKNTEYQTFMNLAKRRSQVRIVAFNKFWDSMVMLSDTSKIIYRDLPGKLAFYLLYPELPIPNAPPAPVNLMWTIATDTFSWDAVPTATSYQLVFRANGATEWEEVYTGAAYSVVFDPGPGEWEFKVRARNAGGYGDYSVIIQILVPGGLDVPANVALVYFPAPDDYLQLTWDAVTGATGYKLYQSIVNIGQPSGIYTSPTFPISSPYVVNNPIAGKRYYYKVAATAPGKMSEPSAEVYVDVS